MRTKLLTPRLPMIVLGSAMFLACQAWAAELVSTHDLERMALQRFWDVKLPLDAAESIARISRVEENLYVQTTLNRIIAVHVHTGIIRWSRVVAEEGQAVRGPTHAAEYALFTAAGSVLMLDRSTGEPAVEPRTLRGVVIESARDHVTVSVGEDHGLSVGDVLGVYRANELGDEGGPPIARLRVNSVRPRSSRGVLQRIEGGDEPRAGDRVRAELVLPIRQVKLPFAASSAAVSDGEDIYFGAANQRFYSLRIRGGTINWQLFTPQAVSATPILLNGNLYFGGQNGLVVSCTKAEKAKNWTFQTEGPVFANLVLDVAGLFVASSDRSLYLLERESGRRLWRERFDTPLDQPPSIAGERLYQSLTGEGLFAMEVKSGRRLWHRAEGGQFLIEIGEDAYVFEGNGAGSLLRLNSANGRRKESASVRGAALAAASREDQAMFLATPTGAMVCLRSKHAPRLTPGQLEAALKNDRKMQLAAEMTAKKKEQMARAKTAMEAKPARLLFEDDDGLASRSTAKPVGGHGVIPLEPAEKIPAKADKDDAGEAKDKAAEGDEDEAAAGEEGEDKPADDAEEAESDEEKPAAEEDKDSDESGDESAGEEEAEEDAGEEEKIEKKKKDDDGG